MVKDTLKHLAHERETTIKHLIVSAVKEAGSISGAARRLGVASNAIRYQMNRHNLIAVRKQERTELLEMESGAS